MLTQRVVVALIVGPVLLISAYLGGWFYFAPVTALILTAAHEYSRIMGHLGRRAPSWLLIPCVFALLLAGQLPQWGLAGPALLASVFSVLVYALWLYERRVSDDAALDWFSLVAGVVLLGWVGSHFFLLRGLPEMAWQWTILTLIISWMDDVGAFFVGRFLAGTVLGRHSLSPRLSPKKTVEGYVGGIVIAALAAVAIAYLLQLPIGLALLLGLILPILAPAGDLAISLLKREAGVKDSGTIFPGHGGALDRLDSMLWSMAIAFYLITFLGPFF